MAKTTKLSNVFLTGCDENTEWMLPWFIENYKKHNKTPLLFADFGVTPKTLEYVRAQVKGILDLSKWKGKGWFLKPKSMVSSPAQKTCWIDTDCQVHGDISGIFDEVEPEKLSMAIDHPWTTRRQEIWHNSGVVAYQGVPTILRSWNQNVERGTEIRGDQEVLHAMLNPITKMTYIKDLPHKYNVLRLDIIDGKRPKDELITHWTGNKGKDEIRRQMNA